jgi:hypothetical protein
MTFVNNSLYIKINDPEKKAVMLRRDYFLEKIPENSLQDTNIHSRRR